MQTTLQHHTTAHTDAAHAHISVWKRFVNWADRQDNNRILWTAIAIAGHGCIFTILTMFTILLTGNNFIYWPFAIAAMSACVIVNLAAMPTRITIPVLLVSVLVDVVIIALCLTHGFDTAAIYR